MYIGVEPPKSWFVSGCRPSIRTRVIRGGVGKGAGGDKVAMACFLAVADTAAATSFIHDRIQLLWEGFSRWRAASAMDNTSRLRKMLLSAA